MPIVSQRSGRDDRAALYPPELLPYFDDSFITSFDFFEEYVARLTLALFRSTGLEAACLNETTVSRAVAHAGLTPGVALVPGSWILAIPASRTCIEMKVAANGERLYRTGQPLPVLDADETLERQRAHDPRCLPSFEIAALAAAHYPAVLRGQTSGEQALFGPEGIVPWVKYFSNDNPLYAISNKVGAIAAARRCRPGKPPSWKSAAGWAAARIRCWANSKAAAMRRGSRPITSRKYPRCSSNARSAIFRRATRNAASSLPRSTSTVRLQNRRSRPLPIPSSMASTYCMF